MAQPWPRFHLSERFSIGNFSLAWQLNEKNKAKKSPALSILLKTVPFFSLGRLVIASYVIVPVASTTRCTLTLVQLSRLLFSFFVVLPGIVSRLSFRYVVRAVCFFIHGHILSMKKFCLSTSLKQARG